VILRETGIVDETSLRRGRVHNEKKRPDDTSTVGALLLALMSAWAEAGRIRAPFATTSTLSTCAGVAPRTWAADDRLLVAIAESAIFSSLVNDGGPVSFAPASARSVLARGKLVALDLSDRRASVPAHRPTKGKGAARPDQGARHRAVRQYGSAGDARKPDLRSRRSRRSSSPRQPPISPASASVSP
jgi:hypothetical protein